MQRFLGELKRRKVYQAGILYLVLAVGGLELVDVLVPTTTLPEWTGSLLVVLAIVGFPIVIVLAWMFDIGRTGIERTASVPVAEGSPAPAHPAATEARTAEGDETPSSTDEHAAPGAAPEDAGLDPNTIAVLPFANLSDSSGAAPFAAGLHDDLLTELSRSHALTVISRTSVRCYADTTKSMIEIGRELGAGTIIEGGVQQAGDRVRLNVQLIDARTDAHLWAERFDRELSTENIFDLQTELADRIMEHLHATLAGAEHAKTAAAPTGDLEAYRQYSLGRAFFVERSEEALRSAAKHYEKAVERDPDYALAWAGTSMALTMLYEYGHEDSDELLERAEAAAQRALKLDPALAEAHSAIGLLGTATRRASDALAAHNRAADLRPGYAGAHQWRCWASLLGGNLDVALEAGRRAVLLDPLEPEARGDLACALLGLREDEEALREARRTLEHHPDYDWPRWLEGLALLHLGRDDEAKATLARLSEGWATAWPRTMVALSLVESGDEAGAVAAVEELTASGHTFYAAVVRLAMTDATRGIEALRGALPLAWDGALYLRYFHSWPLAEAREHPRWTDLIADLDRAWGA